MLTAEMPTSGDLKSGDSPLKFQRNPPPPKKKLKLTQPSMRMMYILSKFEIIVLMLEIIFVND